MSPTMQNHGESSPKRRQGLRVPLRALLLAIAVVALGLAVGTWWQRARIAQLRERVARTEREVERIQRLALGPHAGPLIAKARAHLQALQTELRAIESQ
ncbi:MAG: hypothetical protein U0794_03700 [Isosphaeraceae bacterium]